MPQRLRWKPRVLGWVGETIHKQVFGNYLSASKQPVFQPSGSLVVVLLPTTKKDRRALRFPIEGFKRVKKRDDRGLYHPLPPES